jgi:predicted dehydrogenase
VKRISKAANHPSRRRFLGTTAAVAGASLALPALAPQVHAAGNDTLRIGLVGCGGRGTGAALNALRADPNVKLYALGDTFRDQTDKALKQLRDEDVAAKLDVTQERCFSGFDAYKQVIDCCDVVLLCTPPHFRPMQLRAAVDAGKHVFCEKPVAVDAPGVRRVLETSRDAKQKGLSIVSGLCYRYEQAKRDTMKQIHDGVIGDIVTMHTTYDVGFLWHKKREPQWSDMEWQVRNWLYFTWLSGDHIVEQHIHSLDKMAWAMKDEHPVKAIGMGGRQVRTAPEYGHIFDHHAVVFEYANGVKLFSFCRQQKDCANDVSDFVMGTRGTAEVQKHSIVDRGTGKKIWSATKRKDDNMYQNEHNELFAAIRAGKPINNGEYMSHSTLLAIMGRMASYTGQVITWEMALNSKEDLSPLAYEWGKLPVPAVPVPGQTKFV